MTAGSFDPPPDFAFALYLAWQSGSELSDSELSNIADEAVIEPLDEPCVYWDTKDPKVLFVSIGVAAETHDLAARRSVKHVHDVLQRFDPAGHMVNASVMDDEGTAIFTGLDPEWSA